MCLVHFESQASVSEKLEKTAKKIKDTFMGFAGAVLEIVGPIVDILLPAFNTISAAIKLMFEGLVAIGQILGVIVGIAALLNAKLVIGALASMISAAFTSFKDIPFGVGFALATAATLAGAGLIKRLVTGDDIFSPGGDQAGYGKRTLLAPEGAIALNNKDTVIAGTNLFGRANDMVSSPEGSVSVGSDMNKTNALLATLVSQNNKKPQISPVGLYLVQ